MVIFSKFSPTSAGLICQRSLDTKLPALGNTQTLKCLIRSPLKSVPAPVGENLPTVWVFPWTVFTIKPHIDTIYPLYTKLKFESDKGRGECVCVCVCVRVCVCVGGGGGG